MTSYQRVLDLANRLIRSVGFRYALSIFNSGDTDQMLPEVPKVQVFWLPDTAHYRPEDYGFSDSIVVGRKAVKGLIR